MLTVSSLQLNAWIATLLWPAARVLALVSVAPLFSHAALPNTVKLAFGLLLAIAVAPGLPALPQVSPFSWEGLLILLQQVLVGLTLGFAMRVAVAAVEFAGELVALGMGISFASFYDPSSRGQTTAVSQLFGWLALMVFVASNLHLVTLAQLADSFQSLPIAVQPLSAAPARGLLAWCSAIFSSGLQLALPVAGAMLVTNLALAILTRAAPQLNLFGVGFPVTLGVGFLMIATVLPYLSGPIVSLFEHALAAQRSLLGH